MQQARGAIKGGLHDTTDTPPFAGRGGHGRCRACIEPVRRSLSGPRRRAAAPPTGKQASGFYRYKVGDYELTQIHDGALNIPMPNGFVKNVSREQALAAAEAAYMPKGRVVVPFNPVVINTGSKLVLIDSGFGAVNPMAGQLPANLAAAGIDAKAIDIVILSHLHPDHINGVKTKDNQLAFPNAEIKVPAPDWAFWMSEENNSKAQSSPMMKAYFGNVRRVLADIAGKLTRYEADKEVAPGITSIATHGHTPGHMSFAVASGSSRARAVGCHQHSGAVPAASRLACRVRR